MKHQFVFNKNNTVPLGTLLFPLELLKLKVLSFTKDLFQSLVPISPCLHPALFNKVFEAQSSPALEPNLTSTEQIKSMAFSE